MGDWKGIIQRPGNEMELYHLKEDISETNNLANRKSDVVVKIRSIMSEARLPERDYQPEARRRTVEDFVQLN